MTSPHPTYKGHPTYTHPSYFYLGKRGRFVEVSSDRWDGWARLIGGVI